MSVGLLPPTGLGQLAYHISESSNITLLLNAQTAWCMEFMRDSVICDCRHSCCHMFATSFMTQLLMPHRSPTPSTDAHCYFILRVLKWRAVLSADLFHHNFSNFRCVYFLRTNSLICSEQCRSQRGCWGCNAPSKMDIEPLPPQFNFIIRQRNEYWICFLFGRVNAE